jgi:hypothetical protein
VRANVFCALVEPKEHVKGLKELYTARVFIGVHRISSCVKAMRIGWRIKTAGYGL